jgi:hypothetical protein
VNGQSIEERIAAAIANLDKTPLEFLLEVMQDPTYPPGARIECAKAALPFVVNSRVEK